MTPGANTRFSPVTGRGFAPPPGGERGWWLVWLWFIVEFHPRWWRLGLSVRPWTFGVYLGPLVLAVARPSWRWRVEPQTETALTGDTWQDVSWTISVSTESTNAGASDA